MNGLKRGLQLIVDFLRALFVAMEKGNSEATLEAVSIGKQWLRETTDVAGIVKISAWTLLFGADPWQDSRKMYQAFHLKWAGKL